MQLAARKISRTWAKIGGSTRTCPSAASEASDWTSVVRWLHSISAAARNRMGATVLLRTYWRRNNSIFTSLVSEEEARPCCTLIRKWAISRRSTRRYIGLTLCGLTLGLWLTSIPTPLPWPSLDETSFWWVMTRLWLASKAYSCTVIPTRWSSTHVWIHMDSVPLRSLHMQLTYLQ